MDSKKLEILMTAVNLGSFSVVTAAAPIPAKGRSTTGGRTKGRAKREYTG